MTDDTKTTLAGCAAFSASIGCAAFAFIGAIAVLCGIVYAIVWCASAAWGA